MNIALKEWAVVIAAMKQGIHSILLRKGGLADKGQEFRMEYSRFLLFPTYEHQSDAMIADPYKVLYREISANPPSPTELSIECWAEVIDSIVIKDLSSLAPFSKLHIWSEEYLKMRLDYKPEKSLHLIKTKVFNFPYPQKVKNLTRYGGCRSWVKLEDEISLDDKKTPG